MNALIVYHSNFGNTQRIAEAITKTMEQQRSARVIRLDQLNLFELKANDLLVFGCPTHKHGVPKVVKAFLKEVPRGALRGVMVAAFDTRYRMPRWKSGSAAPTVARKLRRFGATQVVPPESFFVMAREGPLEEGEIERAKGWAQLILGQLEV